MDIPRIMLNQILWAPCIPAGWPYRTIHRTGTSNFPVPITGSILIYETLIPALRSPPFQPPLSVCTDSKPNYVPFFCFVLHEQGEWIAKIVSSPRVVVMGHTLVKSYLEPGQREHFQKKKKKRSLLCKNMHLFCMSHQALVI